MKSQDYLWENNITQILHKIKKPKLKASSGLCFQWSEQQDISELVKKSTFAKNQILLKKGTHLRIPFKISERQDLNLRPLPPQGSALPSCATSRNKLIKY